VTLSANDSASGSASGAGGVTVANLGDNAHHRRKLTLKGSYITINGVIDTGGGDVDATANVPAATHAGRQQQVHTGSSSSLLSFIADNMNLNGAAGTIGGGASDGSDTVSFYTAGRDIVYGGSGTSTSWA
jgi:hypothetical protein